VLLERGGGDSGHLAQVAQLADEIAGVAPMKVAA